MSSASLIKYFATLFLVLVFFSGFAQLSNKYSRIKVFASQEELKKLDDLGVPVDHVWSKPGQFIISDFSTDEFNKIKGVGLNYEILIDDVQAYYIDQNDNYNVDFKTIGSGNCSGISAQDYPVPINFSLGSMGGFFTYQEVLDHLDTMHSKYPNLITQRAPIDTFLTHENRPIYWLKISDNPQNNESEPEVFYNAIHHAREPAGLSQLIFYMYYLLENYDSDPDIKALVDNTEMYFVPVINPDGYIHNHNTNPNGGGMWRKNRRNLGNGVYGVDLNRNYSYQWGGQGASNTPSSDTYRGASAFSEPETQAVKYFCEQHDFKFALNYHTYSNLLLYPFGYDYNQFTPDHNYFLASSELLVSENNYANIISSDLYPASGVSDDWMYGDVSTKNKIISFTPEVGSAFWPAQNEIIGLCKENMFQNITTARLAGKYAVLDHNVICVQEQTTDYFVYDIQRLGLDSLGAYTVSIQAISANILSVGSNNIYTNLSLLQKQNDSIIYNLDPATQIGDPIQFLVSIDNGSYINYDTINRIFGQTNVIFTENGVDTSKWVTSSWGLNFQDFYTSPASIDDSPQSNYQHNNTSSITLKNPISIPNDSNAFLTFRAEWDIEPGFDFVQLLASTDAQAWVPLCGKHTVLGNSNQVLNEPLYDGTVMGWVKEEVSLDDYLGQQLYLKFQLVSDPAVNGQGFRFDNMHVYTVGEEIDSTSVAISSEKDEIRIDQNIPNPANSSTLINFRGKQDLSTKILIYDAVGRLFDQILISGAPSIQINTSKYAEGVYFYKVQTSGETSATRKMIVKH